MMQPSVTSRCALMLIAPLAMVVTVNAADLDTLLNDYVQEAWHSNLALQGEAAQVEQARALLAGARARYWPELSLSARYTLTDGGRTLSLPVGDLLNPVYSTLNSMLVAQGGSAAFPAVNNIDIPFYRPQEQDTHVSVRQPLYAPALAANSRAQRALVSQREAQQQSMRNELRRDVSVAYLNWLQASAMVQIVDSAATLLRENLRINQSLFANGKVTEDQPLRARAELLGIEQQLQSAQQQQAEAQRWLNFLRNQPLDAALTMAERIDTPLPAVDTGVLQQQAQSRAELRALAALQEVSEQQVTIAVAEARPSLALGVDVGTQGERYGLGHGYNYVSGSLLLNWKFYAGGGLRAQVDSARAQQRRVQLQREQAQAQITMQVQTALDRYHTAQRALSTAEARLAAATAALRIATRKRDEGVINQVEYLDARNAMTSAELNLNVTRFAARIEWAQLQYAAALPES